MIFHGFHVNFLDVDQSDRWPGRSRGSIGLRCGGGLCRWRGLSRGRRGGIRLSCQQGCAEKDGEEQHSELKWARERHILPPYRDLGPYILNTITPPARPWHEG